MWETGMDINKVVAAARKHNIPIARSGVYHGYSGFEQKLIDDKFFKAPVLEYRTKIGELGSKIFLNLSDQPRQVYEIEVGIYGIKDREQFLRRCSESSNKNIVLTGKERNSSSTRLRADAPQLAVGRKREVTAPKPWRRRVSRSGAVPLCSVTDAPQLAAGSFTILNGIMIRLPGLPFVSVKARRPCFTPIQE